MQEKSKHRLRAWGGLLALIGLLGAYIEYAGPWRGLGLTSQALVVLAKTWPGFLLFAVLLHMLATDSLLLGGWLNVLPGLHSPVSSSTSRSLRDWSNVRFPATGAPR